MVEVWTVDGYNLKGTSNGVPIREIELNEGLYSPPSAVGSNGTLSNFTGELWRPKKHGPGKFVLNLFLAPNPAGQDGLGVRVLLDAAIDELYRVFQHTERLLRFERTLTSGEVRVCYGEVVTLSPAPIGKGNAGYRFAVEVNVPSAYWTSVGVVDNTTAPSNAESRTVALTSFAGSTATLEDLVLTITGGATNPRIQDTTNADLTSVNPLNSPAGDWVQYYGTIPDDAALIVDCSNWTISGIGGASIGGFNPSIGAVTHSGGRFLTVPAPRPGRSSTVLMTAVNVTSNCALRVAGHKFFQV